MYIHTHIDLLATLYYLHTSLVHLHIGCLSVYVCFIEAQVLRDHKLSRSATARVLRTEPLHGSELRCEPSTIQVQLSRGSFRVQVPCWRRLPCNILTRTDTTHLRIHVWGRSSVSSTNAWMRAKPSTFLCTLQLTRPHLHISLSLFTFFTIHACKQKWVNEYIS